MTIRGVAYDVNGTIIDDTQHFLCAINRIFEIYGFQPPLLDELRIRFGQPWTKIYREEGITENIASEKDLYVLYNKFYNEGLDSLKPFEDLRPCLDLLNNSGLLLFIVSTQQNSVTIPFLKKHNLANFFKAIEGGVSDKAAALIKLANDYKLAPRELVYVGDQEGDMMHAKNAGCIPIGFCSGLHDAKRLFQGGAKEVAMTHSAILKNILKPISKQD